MIEAVAKDKTEKEIHKNKKAPLATQKSALTTGLLSFNINFIVMFNYLAIFACVKSLKFTVSKFLRNMVEVFWLCFVKIIDKLLINIHKLEIDCNIAVFMNKNRVNEFG